MHIELLENRIAPAGIVKITITPTDIKVTGDDAANIIEEAEFVDWGAVRITAQAGTQLEFNGAAGTSFDIPVASRKNLIVDLGAGDDELSMADFEPWAGAIAVNGGAGANTVSLAGAFDLGGAFSYTGGADTDELLVTTTQFHAAGVLVDVGGGANSVKWSVSELDATKGMKLRSGNGDDVVELSGSSAVLGGLDVNLGDGANSMTVSFGSIWLGGIAKFVGGAGPDVMQYNPKELGVDYFEGSAAYFRKGISADLGGGENSFILKGSDSLTVRGALALKFGGVDANSRETQFVEIDGKDFLIGSFSAIPEVGDEVLVAFGSTDPGDATRTMRFGDIMLKGARTVTMNATAAVAILGKLDVHAGNFAEGMSLMVTSPFFHVGKDLLYATGAGAGGSRIVLDADVANIGGTFGVSYNLGDTGSHEVGHLTQGARFSAKSVMISDPGIQPDTGAMTLNFQSSIETGAFTVKDKAGDVDATFGGANVDVEGFLKVEFGQGSASLAMEGSSFSAGGVSLRSVAGLGDTEVVSFVFHNITWTFLEVEFGDAASAFSIEADRGRIGAAAISMGGGANFGALIGNESANGEYLRVDKLRYSSAAGLAAPLDRLVLGGIQSTKDVAVAMGAADSVVKMFNSRISRIAAVLGAGADSLEADDTIFAGAATFNGGLGADSFAIELGGAFAGITSFRGPVKFDLGAGDDTLTIASASEASFANFTAAVTVDGGEGADTYTAHPTNATFGIIAILIGL